MGGGGREGWEEAEGEIAAIDMVSKLDADTSDGSPDTSAFDEKGGACASLMEIFDYPFNHRPMVRSRVLMDECAGLLTEFFKGLRD